MLKCVRLFLIFEQLKREKSFSFSEAAVQNLTVSAILPTGSTKDADAEDRKWVQGITDDLTDLTDVKVSAPSLSSKNRNPKKTKVEKVNPKKTKVEKVFGESTGDIEMNASPLLQQTSSGDFRLRSSNLETLNQAAKKSESRKWYSCCFCCSNCSCGQNDEVPFVDYFPTRFEDIRLRGCGIETQEYVKSLRKTTKERFSEGASGAFLFFSADQRYIIKSMTQEEFHVLMTILPSYHNYIIAHPKTMLTRFMGCHSVQMQYTGNVYFCVMMNCFHGSQKIHETYDLKGSWVDRAGALPSGNGTSTVSCRFCDQWYRVGVRRSLPGQTCTVRPNGQHLPKIIFKDMDVNWKFELSRTKGEHLHLQLCSDADFLMSHGIMDYSLLIGK